MAIARPSRHLLSPSQLEALTSPFRLAIIRRLEIDKTATARDLAQGMGRPVTSLYHHLKLLQEIGLLHVVGERRGDRRPEAVFAMVADHFSSAEAVKTEAGRKIYGRAGARVAEAGGRASRPPLRMGCVGLGVAGEAP